MLVARAVFIAALAAAFAVPTTRHDTCCTSQADCGAAAVCSPYPFHVANHCPRVCRDKCKANTDCPIRPGGPGSHLFCTDGLCELPGPGN